MNILLINPPEDLQSLLGFGQVFVQKYEPLGLLYIAAVIRENGYNVSVIDAFAEELSSEDIQERITRLKPDIIGISTLTCNGEIVFNLGRWIKENFPKILVILGNIHASVYSKQYLKYKCCDIVVHGEGEEIFLEIIKWHEKKKELSGIPSISFLNENNEEFKTGGMAVVRDLGKLPLPSRDLVDQRLYNFTEISNQMFVGSKRIITRTMFTSRGCLNRCTFCVVHGGEKQRFNCVNNVVDEMETLNKKYNVSYIYIMDSFFFGNLNRVSEICSEIRRRGLKIQWGADGHVRYINKEIIADISSAGCYELSFGFESGVQRLLNNIRKRTTIEQAEKAAKLVKKYSKIKVGGLFILGLPGETYQDSLQTIKFAKRLPLDIAQFNIIVPYPGSPLFEELRQRNEIDTGIRDDGNLDTSVWKRYSSYASFTKSDPIWINPYLSASKLKELQKRALREFYLRPSQIIKHIKRIRPDNISKIFKITLKGFFEF